VHDELPANDAVGLGVAAALEPAGLPEAAHLAVEAGDDGVDPHVLVGDRPLLGDLQVLPGPASVDEARGEPGQRVAQHRVEGGPHERVDPPLEVDEERRRVGEPVQHGGARIGPGEGAAGVRVRRRGAL
jgi:hypothetical protein